ncbi:hypothetical protein LIT25_15715 [Bacillus sp. F19]|nr:hypothetical protein LIT25_15715 [Bacillus sp. F19]
MHDERYDIHWNNKDIVQKMLFNGFPKGTKPLEIFNIDTAEVKYVENTDIATVRTKDDAADCLFRLTDNSLLHIEFQSTFSKDDIRRFCEYDAYLYNKHKDVEIIRTIVIYTNKVNPDNVEYSFNAGSITYIIEPVFLRKHQGDLYYEVLKGKIELDPDIKLTSQEELELIYNPLMDNKDSINDRVNQISKLLKELNDEQARFRILGSILAFHVKEMNENTLNNLWEVLSMGAVFEDFKKEVVEKAEKEGYLKAIKVLMDQGLVSDEEIIKVYRLTPGDLRKLKEQN